MKQIFPSEIINLSVENHFSKFSKKSHLIYATIILALSGCVVSLFLIKTEITVQSMGLIRSSSEPIQINSPVVAEVIQSNLEENKFVNKGDTLILLNCEKFKEKILHLENLMEENKAYLTDLTKMLGFKYSSLKTDLLKTTHSQYSQKLSEFDINIELLQKSYDRAFSLFDKKVIPLTEIEDKKFQLDKMLEEKKIFIQMSRNEWQRMATTYKLENKRYSNEIDGLYRDMENFAILAPGTGSIANYNGIRAGSYVTTGQLIAAISPNDSIITEHMVPPKDIGYLSKGMIAIFQVDAYNYNQWGLASGEIIDISNEIYFLNNQPFFKVRCSLNETHLTLKNGYIGKLKKGLTATARFKVTERTLAQLLFDKTDDWLNPKIINK